MERNIKPRWLYQAFDAEGRATQGFVEADTAEEARMALAQQQPPLSQITLHTQDIHARATTEMMNGASSSLDARTLRQIARVQIDVWKQPGLWTMLRPLLRANAGWLLVCTAFLALALWLQAGWIVVLSLVAPMLVPFAQLAYLYRFQRLYEAVLHAFVIGNRQRLEELAGRLAQLAQRRRFLRQPAWDAALRTAWFDARQNGTAAAMARLRIHPLRPAEEAEFMACSYKIYLATGDYEGFDKCLRELIAQRPGDFTITLNLALCQARTGHTQEAEHLRAQLPTEQLPPHSAAFIAWLHGLIALRDPASAQAAIGHLENACGQFLDMVRKTPATLPSLAACTCDYALALAWCGRKEEAIDAFASVRSVALHHVEPARLALLERELR